MHTHFNDEDQEAQDSPSPVRTARKLMTGVAGGAEETYEAFK